MKKRIHFCKKVNFVFFILTLVCSKSNILTGQITSIMSSFHSYDINRDGIVEINQLTAMPFEENNGNFTSDSKLVIVLVEERLLNTLSNSPYSDVDIVNRLNQFKKDLRAEGYVSYFIKADVYHGIEHQDGQTLLAIRRFLKDIKRSWDLQGVILVGSFPEAMLVRRWIWRVNDKFTIGTIEYADVPHLRIVPEIVAHRADIVLADLDGNWENIYVKGPMKLESIEAIPVSGTVSNWPVNGMTFTSTKFNDTALEFKDFFWIRDDDYQRLSPLSSATLKLKIFTNQRHPEISLENRSQANPIASPDILVSRINAKNIAVLPDRNIKDSKGRNFLDLTGRPQTIEIADEVNPNPFVKDPIVERSLLIRYFDRNHSYRIGGNPLNSHRTAAASFGDGIINAQGMNDYLKIASPTFDASVSFNDASLYQYVEFLKTPATLKGISSHSNPWNSAFGDSYNLPDLESLIGDNPWRWEKNKVGNLFNYSPSLSEQSGTADSYIHRTIYENNILKETGANLFIHNGCEVNSPEGSSEFPYNHNNYGSANGFQNAESILFFLNGVALASRAKVFYDKPEGFTEEIGKNVKNNFGDGWRAYFTKEANNSEVADVVADNRRSYTWSIIGDWTLRIKYDNGLGIFKLDQSGLKNYTVNANYSWLNEWNFESRFTKIEGKGDFNGDGFDDILISSSWGLGLLSTSDSQCQSIVVKPKNTWFGNWNYNATGNDKIEAIADFDNDGKDEILITSSWGIGILKLEGNSFNSMFLAPNGTSFGGWTYNTSSVIDNKIEGTGDFNGDGKTDILVSKSYGIALLSLSENTLKSIVVKPKNTWFGNWNYNATGNDKIEAIADFDNDGKDEILITSSWGIGILKLEGNSFNSIFLAPNGTLFGRWTYNTSSVTDNKIEGTGDFNGDGKTDILVSKPAGIGLLTLSGNVLRSIVAKPVGTKFGDWTYNTNTVRDNVIQKVGDFNGDGKADVLVSKPYGIGILTLDGTTFRSVDIRANNTKIGDWHLNINNTFPVIGNFDGRLGDEIIIVNK